MPIAQPIARPRELAVRGTALAEHVRLAIREDILSLRLAPGTVIDKAQICEELGVSKFPVTDALSRLQDEGLVEVRARSGTVVSLIRIHEVQQAAFIRRSLEIESVRAMAPNSTPELLRRLEHNLSYQQSAVSQGDRSGFHEFDLEFHEILLHDLGYPRVEQVIATWRGPLDRARRLNAPERRQGQILVEHETIKEAIALKDGSAAARAMRNHLDAGLEALTQFMLSQPDIFEAD